MAEIFPFRGYLPGHDLAARVVSKPYDKYTISEVEQIVRSNPVSFLHVIKPDLASGIKRNPADPESLKRSREQFKYFAKTGVFHQSERPSFYIYRQEKPAFTYTGIVATILSADYRNDTIRIHEQTLALKEEKLKDYLQIVGINAEPVMFTYPHTEEIDALMNRLTATSPAADFIADGKRQLLWMIHEPEDIRKIKDAFVGIRHVYVADGHHRSASSVLLSEELEQRFPDAPSDAPWRSFMGIFFPDHNLQLLAFNRLLKDTGGISSNEILEKLALNFHLEKLGSENFKPRHKLEFSMYMEGNWYAIRFKEIPPGAEDQLDAELLNLHILSPIFGVQDLRKDPRIDFIPELEGSSAMREMVNNGKAALAFGLYPVSFRQFFSFSDQGKTMPPKSTWFEPKLLNGLVVYDLEIPIDAHH
jgi:uncharacterized protein (DUF1015 family)